MRRAHEHVTDGYREGVLTFHSVRPVLTQPATTRSAAMALGYQSKFDWGAVGRSGLSAGLTYGIKQELGLNWAPQKVNGAGWGELALYQAERNVISQGVNLLVGQRLMTVPGIIEINLSPILIPILPSSNGLWVGRTHRGCREYICEVLVQTGTRSD